MEPETQIRTAPRPKPAGRNPYQKPLVELVDW